MAVLERIQGWWVRDKLARAEQAARAHGAGEREAIEEEAEGHKADRFVMEGNGSVAPMLPVGLPDELGRVFEHDSEPPPDEAP